MRKIMHYILERKTGIFSQFFTYEGFKGIIANRETLFIWGVT